VHSQLMAAVLCYCAVIAAGTPGLVFEMREVVKMLLRDPVYMHVGARCPRVSAVAGCALLQPAAIMHGTAAVTAMGHSLTAP
jgi:hypothetical protein